jgi:hypothetical protein
MLHCSSTNTHWMPVLSCGVQLEIDTYPWLRRKAVQVQCCWGCC